MIQFERGKDIRKSIRIGRCNERVFTNIREAAEWCVEYPEEYTKGIVHDWFSVNPELGIPYYDVAKSQFNHESFRKGNETTGKLQMVKWIKENLHFSAHPEAIIGLKDSKMIIDLAEELIGIKIISKRYNIDESEFVQLQKMMDKKMLEVETLDFDKKGDTEELKSQYLNGYKDAFNDIKSMIKYLKENK